MNAPSTPEEMTEAERMQEIGRLLATAIERLRKPKSKTSGAIVENSLDSVDEESVYA